MCLLILAWNAHPRYRLVFAGNRDEFHARPAAPMAWWADRPDLLAGRDLEAGGTWLGIARDTRFAVVTNYRELQRPLPGAPSRGGLITQWFDSGTSATEYTDRLRSEADRYSGFNLLLADPDSLLYASNRLPGFSRVLEPGVHALSNHLLDTPWPKVERTRERFRGILAQQEPSADALLEMLADRAPAADHLLPSTGLSREWELLLSSPFIVDERYGTRCSTVVRVDRDGHASVRERCFDPLGRSTGMGEFSFSSPSSSSSRASDALPA